MKVERKQKIRNRITLEGDGGEGDVELKGGGGVTWKGISKGDGSSGL